MLRVAYPLLFCDKTSKGMMECDINRRIGAVSAVAIPFCCQKAKLLISLTYGHKLWDPKNKSAETSVEMSFLHKVAGRTLRNRVRSSVTR